ncbi:MAG TPA: hypothetical protein PLK77_16365, partial [Pyrinomonadaceae bacterium]|nr:hypothetical protein [Pyrinomonadaceae bacterium]
MTQITDFFIRHSDKTWFGIAVIVLACFVTIILPIYLGGIRIIPDLRSYVNFAQAFQEAFDHGRLCPEWTGDNLGFGSVGIRFYPPLAPLLTALVKSVTEDWYLAFWISLF